MKRVWRICFMVSYIALLVLLFMPERDSVSLSFHSCQTINCSYALVELLNEMPHHVCAFYDLEDDAIYEVINQGLLFEENYEEKYSKLQKVSSKGLMHHKFCVFQDQYVFTGSWNPTQRGTNVNDNYIIFIDSKKIAQRYMQEYIHLQERSHQVAPLTLYYNTSYLELYFCPQHDCQQQVIDTLALATDSVRILAFTFTDEEIAEKLLALSRNGISVELIYEKTRITKYSTIHSFTHSAIQTLYDGNSYTMHEKMMIIDDEIVILGSYNPTKSATQKNDENILIIHDNIFALLVLEEYRRVRSQAIS